MLEITCPSHPFKVSADALLPIKGGHLSIKVKHNLPQSPGVSIAHLAGQNIKSPEGSRTTPGTLLGAKGIARSPYSKRPCS